MRRGLFHLSLAVFGLLMMSVALGLGSSRPAGAQGTDLEKGLNATLQAAVHAYNQGDLITLKRLFTDEGFQGLFGETKSEATSDPEFFGDQVKLRTIREVMKTETGASATAEFEVGLGLEVDDMTFLFLGGIWVVASSQTGSAEVPIGATVVNLSLQEFAFGYDATAVASGDFVFKASNTGTQDHEIGLLKLSEALSPSELIDVLSSEDESGPAPFEDFGFFGTLSPGESINAALSHPLDEGFYALVCFLPDTDGVPHAFKGMISEFTVGAPEASPISPPNTGDAGLAESGRGINAALMSLVALTLVLGLASGLRARRS